MPRSFTWARSVSSRSPVSPTPTSARIRASSSSSQVAWSTACGRGSRRRRCGPSPRRSRNRGRSGAVDSGPPARRPVRAPPRPRRRSRRRRRRPRVVDLELAAVAAPSRAGAVELDGPPPASGCGSRRRPAVTPMTTTSSTTTTSTTSMRADRNRRGRRGPTGAGAASTLRRPWHLPAPPPASRSCSRRRCSRSRRSSSARTGPSSGSSCACSPAATASSRACPAWPRRSPARPSPGSPAAPSPACSSRPTSCPPTSSAPASTGRRPRRSTSSSGRCSPTSSSPTRSTGRRPRCSRRCSRSWPSATCRSAAQTYHVPEPFLVLATQNPIESEGVYPLPEAQRDRFLMKVLIGYPSRDEEVEVVLRMGVNPPRGEQVLSPAEVLELQAAADRVYVDRGVVDYAVNLVLATRDAGAVRPRRPRRAHRRTAPARGPASASSPPGRALALLRGRSYVLPQDVFDCAPDVLRHRLVLSYEALAPQPHGRPPPRPHPRHGAGAAHRAVRWPSRRPAPAAHGAADDRRRSRPAAVMNGSSASAGEVLRRLELTVTRRLDGLLHGDHRGLVPGPRLRARRDAPVPARRRRPPHRLERDRPHPGDRTCARRSPTASSRRGCSSTCRPASSSAPRLTTKRDAGRRPRPPPSASSPPAAATASAPCSSSATARRSIVPARGGRDHLRAVLHRMLTADVPDGTGATDLAGRPRAAGAGRPAAAASPSSSPTGSTTIPLARRRRAEPLRRSRAPRDAAPSRSSTPASSSCPTSASSSWSTPRPGARREIQTGDAPRCGRATRPPPTTPGRARHARSAPPAPTTSLLRTDRDWLGDLVAFVATRRDRAAALGGDRAAIAMKFLDAGAAVAARRSSPSSSPSTSCCSSGAGRPTRCGSRTSPCSTSSRRSDPGWRRHVTAAALAARRWPRSSSPWPKPARDVQVPRRAGDGRARHRHVAVDAGDRRPAQPPRRRQGRRRRLPRHRARTRSTSAWSSSPAPPTCSCRRRPTTTTCAAPSRTSSSPRAPPSARRSSPASTPSPRCRRPTTPTRPCPPASS